MQIAKVARLGSFLQPVRDHQLRGQIAGIHLAILQSPRGAEPGAHHPEDGEDRDEENANRQHHFQQREGPPFGRAFSVSRFNLHSRSFLI